MNQNETREFYDSLEAERLALFDITWDLTPSKRRSIAKAIDIIVNPTRKNQPRKRAQDLLLSAIKHRKELFLLCACAGHTGLIGFSDQIQTTLDITAVLRWWDSVSCPEKLKNVCKDLSSDIENALKAIKDSTRPFPEHNSQSSPPLSREGLDILQDPPSQTLQNAPSQSSLAESAASLTTSGPGPNLDSTSRDTTIHPAGGPTLPSAISNLQSQDLFAFLTELGCSPTVTSNTWGADPAYSSYTIREGVTMLLHNDILYMLLEYSRILGRGSDMQDGISAPIYIQDFLNFIQQYKTGCDPLTIQTSKHTLELLPAISIVYGPSNREDVRIILQREALIKLVKYCQARYKIGSLGLQFC